jgi:hypothetical protein
MPFDPKTDNRAMQWNDLSGRGRQIVSDNIRSTGQNVQKIAQKHVETLSRSKKSTPGKVATAQGVADAVEPRNVTLQTAANARQALYNRGIEARRSENPDDPHQVIPHGAGWYYDAHKKIADSAAQHGYDAHTAIAASGVMSPMNSPDNEQAAVHAMMDAKINHTVHITPEVASHLKTKANRTDVSIDVDHHIGKEVSIASLPTGALAKLSDRRIADQVKTGADLHNIARGGTRQNITRADAILSGEVHPDEAVNPHSAPKVWSYVHNLRSAAPGTPDHVEFMGRVHQDAAVRAGHIEPEQQALDLYGHKDRKLPDDHLLSPKSHTVEDTWQNAITFDQPNKTVPGTKTSVKKAGGSFTDIYPVAGVKTTTNPETGKRESAHPSGQVSNAGLTHAFNNRATQKAAEQQGRQSGTTVPPVAVQGAAWTQVRKETGKDPVYNRRETQEADPLQGHVGGQQALFSAQPHLRSGADASAPVYRDTLPGGQKAPSVSDEPTHPGDIEPELRRAEAIFNNRRKKNAKQTGVLDGF